MAVPPGTGGGVLPLLADGALLVAGGVLLAVCAFASEAANVIESAKVATLAANPIELFEIFSTGHSTICIAPAGFAQWNRQAVQNTTCSRNRSRELGGRL